MWVRVGCGYQYSEDSGQTRFNMKALGTWELIKKRRKRQKKEYSTHKLTSLKIS